MAGNLTLLFSDAVWKLQSWKQYGISAKIDIDQWNRMKGLETNACIWSIIIFQESKDYSRIVSSINVIGKIG